MLEVLLPLMWPRGADIAVDLMAIDMVSSSLILRVGFRRMPSTMKQCCCRASLFGLFHSSAPLPRMRRDAGTREAATLPQPHILLLLLFMIMMPACYLLGVAQFIRSCDPHQCSDTDSHGHLSFKKRRGILRHYMSSRAPEIPSSATLASRPAEYRHNQDAGRASAKACETAESPAGCCFGAAPAWRCTATSTSTPSSESFLTTSFLAGHAIQCRVETFAPFRRHRIAFAMMVVYLLRLYSVLGIRVFQNLYPKLLIARFGRGETYQILLY